MGRRLVGEGARPRRRVDVAAAGVLHGDGQASVRVVGVPQREVIEVVADAESPGRQPPDDFIHDAVVDEQAGQAALGGGLREPLVKEAERDFVDLRMADGQVVVRRQIPGPRRRRQFRQVRALLGLARTAPLSHPPVRNAAVDD